MKKHHENERRGIDSVDEVYSTDRDGTYSQMGEEESGALPNDPAENAKKTSPEEDAGEPENTKLSAGNSKPQKESDA
ncbi:hypothetical protein DSL64_01790 [Dyadobacter luteus]|jgi:hypothetical protein|uniref:Uncharacterized protein n=1 Tax=Dyadobacter luteus TaxID=2259619 RepID=A0A3D8YI03_9BACT|nr:hypothetical protein [Dyadobacter luteus]REA64305.1 hypothetical protein DSL64_01790 [Dyadobacter luteus]